MLFLLLEIIDVSQDIIVFYGCLDFFNEVFVFGMIISGNVGLCYVEMEMILLGVFLFLDVLFYFGV